MQRVFLLVVFFSKYVLLRGPGSMRCDYTCSHAPKAEYDTFLHSMCRESTAHTRTGNETSKESRCVLEKGSLQAVPCAAIDDSCPRSFSCSSIEKTDSTYVESRRNAR